MNPNQPSDGFVLKIIMQIQYAQTMPTGTPLPLSSAQGYTTPQDTAAEDPSPGKCPQNALLATPFPSVQP